MKPKDIQPKKRNIHLLEIKYCVAEPTQANRESGSGQQQAHSSFTAASQHHTST
jgi:hypothetical protein